MGMDMAMAMAISVSVSLSVSMSASVNMSMSSMSSVVNWRRVMLNLQLRIHTQVAGGGPPLLGVR